MQLTLPSIDHDYAGFEALVRLHAQIGDTMVGDIVIDMSSCYWFDADMCAALGAILYRASDSFNTVELRDLQPRVESILSKNGFLSSYGRQRIPDRWGTTIPYQRFDIEDDRFFADYVERRLVHRSEIPKMSPGLLARFRQSVFEIFSNAVLHSRTRLGIFACGQRYPNKNRLHFCVSDLGIGIRENIRQHLGMTLTPEEAIDWATQGRNTTKLGPIPGGIGLKMLKEFIAKNGGSIQIVSDAGHWQFQVGRAITTRLPHPFPGTVVNIEIDTSDTNTYVSEEEVSPGTIF
jgi:signal transduction histidine kinase